MASNKARDKVIKHLLMQYDKEHPDELRQFKKQVAKYESHKKKVAKKVARKALAKKVLKKLVPGVGAVAIAHDVLKGVSKATCSKRGGKWDSGKCVGAKKTKFKPGSKVKDPISKR